MEPGIWEYSPEGEIILAAGDAQRAWFPEMLEKLKIMWNPDLPWEKCIIICDDMNLFRKEIWDEKGIKPIKSWCSNCKKYHDSRPLAIGVKSMLFALKKIDCIQEDEFKTLEKSWKQYRKKYNLDSYGKKL